MVNMFRAILCSFVCLSILCLASVSCQQTKDVKYAPNYCLRFRFNCQRESQKEHVCCLYPLPIDLKANEQARRPTNNGAAIKFRPVRLPNRRKNSEETVSTERPQVNKNPNR